MDSELRKKILMNTLVEGYVDRIEPISSKELLNRTQLSVSSATVRNDLADLEAEGFVKHLHTSSGRVPTVKGYRFYVDQLSDDQGKSLKLETLNQMTVEVGSSLKDLLTVVSEALKEMTDYPVVLVTENYANNFIKFIKLVCISMHQVLFVMLNSYGQYFEDVLNVQMEVDQEMLNRISEVLTNLLAEGSVGKLDNVDELTLKEIKQRFIAYVELITKVNESLKRSKKMLSQSTVIKVNTEKIYEHPEYKDLQSLRNVLGVLDNEMKLVEIFSSVNNQKESEKIRAFIGEENNCEEMKTSSLVFARAGSKDESACVAMIGPIRMQYKSVYANIMGMVETINNQMEKTKVF